MQNIIHKKEKKLSFFPFIDTGSSEPDEQTPSQIKVKLWQLDHSYHCAIIGTCLTMDEVKKLLRQLHIDINEFPPYELHTTIVTLISGDNFPSKKVQRYLDKKFKTTVQKTKKMNTNEIKSFWEAALYSGKIIDAFWAVMSHPESNELMKKTFYGDIHMLSHMSGASNRADIKRLSLLEKERKEYETEKHSWEVKYHRLTSENMHLMEDAKQQLGQLFDLENQVNALKNSLDHLMILQSTKERQVLENLVEKLTVKLDCQEKEIAKYYHKEQQFAALIANQKQQIIANNDKLLAYQNEVEYLQSALLENSKNKCPLQKQSLCGQCVLYVGGKKNLVPHYRELVEENSGIFIHHDGGIEKNTQDLQQSLSKADVVVFPSACISHDAYWKIKRTCNKQKKPYKYLNSSGLYSLSSVLNTIMSKIENPDTLFFE